MNWNKSASAPSSISLAPSCCGGVKCNDSSASFPAYLRPRLAPPRSCIIIIISHHKLMLPSRSVCLSGPPDSQSASVQSVFLQPAKCTSTSVFLACCPYNLLPPRTSGMTGCKYSHSVFQLKAALHRHAQTLSVYKHTWGAAAERDPCFSAAHAAALLIYQSKYLSDTYPPPPVYVQYLIRLSPTSDGITGWVPADQTASQEHKRRPGHRPVSQLVNVIRRM